MFYRIGFRTEINTNRKSSWRWNFQKITINTKVMPKCCEVLTETGNGVKKKKTNRKKIRRKNKIQTGRDQRCCSPCWWRSRNQCAVWIQIQSEFSPKSQQNQPFALSRKFSNRYAQMAKIGNIYDQMSNSAIKKHLEILPQMNEGALNTMVTMCWQK